jgi:hypothetical protein
MQKKTPKKWAIIVDKFAVSRLDFCAENFSGAIKVLLQAVTI